MNTIRQAIQEYLAMRRDLGFKLERAEKELHSFACFLKEHRATFITVSLALSWATKASGGKPDNSAAQRLSSVRLFARFRRASDPRTEIPPSDLIPFRPQRAKPYLYSEEEVVRLLEATLNMPLSPRHRKNCALLPIVYHCLFGLLAVTGLRLGEARNLKLDDVDLKNEVLVIRDAKFGRDRLIPLHATTCKVLANYITRRQRHWKGRPVTPHLFVSSWGNRLDSGQIHRAFYAVSHRIGLRGENDSHGPRLMDLRHRFATTTLTNWYRSDEEPEKRLPLLSAYLGHIHIADTQWYLSASPELMREAMLRLERRWEKQS